MNVHDVVVLGGGHNGLCAAAFVARAGLDVVVVEARQVAGGATATEELFPGYRFSTCSYALHLLHEEVVAGLGLELDLVELPPRAALLPDGTVLRGDDLTDERWERAWTSVAGVVDHFLIGEPPSVAELRRRAVERQAVSTFDRFASLGVAELVEAELTSPELRAVAAPRYFEGVPEEPGGPLAYAYTETARFRPAQLKGVPRGGMGVVANALARAARDAGAVVRVGARVADVVVERGRACGVRLTDGSVVRARAVASSLPPRARVAGPAAVRLHCALRGLPDVSRVAIDPDELGLVHVYPQLDWYRYAVPDALAGLLPLRSPVEVQFPSFLDPSLVPKDGHSLSVYLPFAPPGFGDADALASLLLAAVERVVPNLGDVLVDHVLLTPAGLERRLGLPGGAIHHVPHDAAHMFDARGGARTQIEGLYACGAGAHPGGEVSGLPGLNAARAVIADLRG